MSVITFERRKLDTTDTYTATVALGAAAKQGNDFYLPITLDNFVSPNIVLNAVNGLSSSNKLTSTVVGYFKDVRVGDVIVSGVSVTSNATPATGVLTNIALVEDSNLFIYPPNFNSTSLPIQAGDSLSSTSLGSNVYVDKIDYVNRIVYMSEPASTTIIEDVTGTKLLRVTGKNDNATEITLSGTLSASITAATVTFKPGAGEALLGLIKVAPVGSQTNGTISIQVSAFRNKGEDVIYARNGAGYSAPQTLNYVNLGNITIDADEFLVDARVPRA